MNKVKPHIYKAHGRMVYRTRFQPGHLYLTGRDEEDIEAREGDFRDANGVLWIAERGPFLTKGGAQRWADRRTEEEGAAGSPPPWESKDS